MTKIYSRILPMRTHYWTQTTLFPIPRLILDFAASKCLPLSTEGNPQGASFLQSIVS